MTWADSNGKSFELSTTVSDYSLMRAKGQVYFAIREVYKEIHIFDSLALGVGGKGANTIEKGR